MIINGVTIPDPDIGDLSFLEKYEAANDSITQKMAEINVKEMRRSEAVRTQCEAVFAFFDTVFGKGTAKAVFGEQVNLKICIDSYEEAVNGVNALDVKLANYFRNKYPNNRQQRRHKKSHHHSQQLHNQ